MNPVRAVPPASGEQHEIRHGTHRAIATEVGATLRHYSVDGVDVVDGFAVDEWAPGGRGQVLAPWPNRLDGGRYEFAGRAGQAALDEPGLGNAIHGLVRWLRWRTVAKSSDAVALACALPPQPGYPWQLELEVGYRLDGEGLTVSVQAHNAAEVPAPFGSGFHPYLTVGIPVDEAVLQVPATRCLVTDERGLPTGSRPVAGSPLDFTAPKRIGPQRLDAGYTDLVRGADGLARAWLGTPGGSRRVGLWVDRSFRYLMVYTGDKLKDESRRRRGVAIEPMTCPPNALRSGTDLLGIEPGGVVGGRWGLVPEERRG